jgi:hypothetical protein
VMTQVDQGLTKINVFGSIDVISTNDAHLKPRASRTSDGCGWVGRLRPDRTPPIFFLIIF